MEWLEIARQAAPRVPLLLGGGATPENVAQAFSVADGVIVATWIKNGNMSNPVDKELARKFMEAAEEARTR